METRILGERAADLWLQLGNARMLAGSVPQWYHDDSIAKPWQEDIMVDVLFAVFALSIIVVFSILAARAEAKMWRAVHRYDGARRALQRQITLGKSRLR